jgi:hypothetical protein
VPCRTRALAEMAIKRPYTYTVLRYRHDPLAAEFANVGVVLPVVGDVPDLDGETLRISLRAIDRELQRLGRSEGGDLLTGPGYAGAYARRVLPADDSSFVWGPVGSGTSDNPADTLTKLYERFVARYDGRAHAHRDDAAVWRPVREKLADLQLADRLQSKCSKGTGATISSAESPTSCVPPRGRMHRIARLAEGVKLVADWQETIAPTAAAWPTFDEINRLIERYWAERQEPETARQAFPPDIQYALRPPSGAD